MRDNHLAGETSRYLLQHVHNPVDWYPWGEAALAKAKRENKPIFLSIGYSACHWCHVMAHESFEDAETAVILNEHFVSIKVDREERPDLDRIYMLAVQAMTRGGGWPMSVFCTPDGQPFYGGTYFPAQPRYGIPSFKQVLHAMVEAWAKQRDELIKSGAEVVDALREQQGGEEEPEEDLQSETLSTAYGGLREQFDATHGGFGGAPKFPQPMALEFLLRYYLTSPKKKALATVRQTLEAMARGGLYDQLGGGFHRYAVDANWLVPHFEKMLYDNAQLARVYLHAWQVTGEPLFRAIVEETLDYVAREMTAPEGGFYATQDADSEGEEGKFFIWTPDEVREALGGPATRFLKLYGITDAGNFEGRNILTFNGTVEEREAIAGARRALFEARERRVRPGRDEKVVASWNGLMLAAFAEAARVFDRDDYRDIAVRSANFLLRELRTRDGRLWHVWNRGEAKVAGLLEDYAHLIEGLLALYGTTFERRWTIAAVELADAMIAHFSAAAVGEAGFFDTADDGERLIVRPREMQDNAMPSGNAMAATVLLALARLSGKSRYADVAEQSLESMQDLMGEHPLAFGQWLVALDSALVTPVDIAIIGDLDAADTRALLDVAQEGYHPHRLVAVGSGDVPPMLAHRTQVDGKPTAYVCVNHVCQPPVTDVGEMRELLGEL